MGYGDSGTYSRFFLIPKAARSDREPAGHQGERVNTHPTVKPVALMRHLVRLVTPPGGTVLDPFLGSGTTALAAEAESFDWIGIEREAEYIAIAGARLDAVRRKGIQQDMRLTA
jgi:site-specific DNA-methyltransferase (adenine-specific)